MSWGQRSGGSPDRTVADLFAGIAVALLVVLVVMWLQALVDAQQIKRLRLLQSIFEDAFGSLGESDSDIVVDKRKGEVTLKAEQAFKSGRWDFDPAPAERALFVRAQTKLSAVLERIDSGFKASKEARDLGLDAKQHVEVLIVGHTDCVRLSQRDNGLEDNWDLSVLRAAALARFLSRPCDDGASKCCFDGSQDCEPGSMGTPLDPSWRVLPAGRSWHELREREQAVGLSGDGCDRRPQDKDWLAKQRRVVIQVVPRTDKILLRLSGETGAGDGEAR